MPALLDAGWRRDELPPPPAGPGAVVALTRASGADGDDGNGACNTLEPPTDRASLAASQKLGTESEGSHEAGHEGEVGGGGWKWQTRAEWQTATLSDPRQAEGPDTSLVIEGYMVMDVDETPNMEDLAEVAVASHDDPARRHGRLLEVGYGLGISARAIQARNVREHVIVEANVDVMCSLLHSPLGASPGVRPLLGFWQEVVPLLGDGTFDSVFFDPFPNDDDMKTADPVHQRPFMRHAFRLLKPGGVFTYMSGGASGREIAADTDAAIAAGFRKEDIKITPKLYMLPAASVAECPTYPECEPEPVPLLVTRLVKR